eukprot:8991090-Karenia_brevis.AAC.1
MGWDPHETFANQSSAVRFSYSSFMALPEVLFAINPATKVPSYQPDDTCTVYAHGDFHSEAVQEFQNRTNSGSWPGAAYQLWSSCVKGTHTM